MPMVGILPNGGTVSIGHKPGNHQRAKRDIVQGWSARASRGNRAFLWSVVSEALTGSGYAVTLTVRDCPPTHDHWHRLRRAYFDRLRRAGMIRAHWVTEWQRRGVPHLHCAIWMPPEYPQVGLTDSWLASAYVYGAQPRSQDVRPINGAPGWFEYLAKHAARGVRNYQRSPENIPPGWHKTGRMWGHLGDWPTVDTDRIDIDWPAFFQYRRSLIRYAIAKARKQGDLARVRYLRTYLQHSDADRSRTRGLSEWAPQETQHRLLAFLQPDQENQR